MADQLHVFTGISAGIEVADIAFHPFESGVIEVVLNVVEGSGQEVVEYPDVSDPWVVEQGIEDIGANESGASGE